MKKTRSCWKSGIKDINLNKFLEYYYLVKPGIVRGNALSLLAGSLFAQSMAGWDVPAFAAVLAGSSLVIAGGCVFNNILDRSIDSKMKRTKNRALITGAISMQAAGVYGTLLALAGLALLWFFTNPLTTLLGIVGLVWYVLIYGFAKRSTPWSTLIGTVCGAIPPVAGYTAITGRLDAAALLLFLILVCWQMPHFYAVAIRRMNEYRAAGIPLLPLTHGVNVTKRQIVVWIVAFTLVAPLLTIAGYTGFTYLTASIALGAYWLTIAVRSWHEPDDARWAGRLFGVSLLVLLVQSGLIAVGGILP